MDNKRWVLISGASTGIGFCCAQTLAKQGWHVFAGVRSETDVARLQALDAKLIPVMLDVTDLSSIEAAQSRIVEHLGGQGLDGLVNNAGIVVGGPMEFVPLDALRYQLEINLIGHVAVTQAMMPLLRQHHGRIVNMGSVAGLTALPFVAPYSISKYALEAWSDALRLELHAWGMHVAVIEPGSIATPLWDKSLARAEELSQQVSPEVFDLYGEALERLRKASMHSASRGIPPEHVARAVIHALTASRPKTRYLVGADARLRRVFRWLPDRLKDRLIAAKIGLKY